MTSKHRCLVAIMAVVSVFAGVANSAQADSSRLFNTISLESGDFWTPTVDDIEIAEGGSVVVLEPGDILTVTVNLDLVEEADWDSTKWEIVDTAISGCVPLAVGIEGPGAGFEQTFTIDTTGFPFGTHTLRLTAYNEQPGGASCSGANDFIALPAAIVICLDEDDDGVCNADDNCPNDANPNQSDGDGDKVGDACDACPLDNPDDTDGDGVCDSDDACPLDNPDDTDGDGVCDTDDPCPLDFPDDTDGDGICDSDDACPIDVQNDRDGDGVCDSDDPCPDDRGDDTDGDGLCDSLDDCPLDNPDDADGDGICDSDDRFPTDPDNDVDGDGVPAGLDNCPNAFNPNQDDVDGNGIGDVCESAPAGQENPFASFCDVETQFAQTLFWRYPLCACAAGSLMFIPVTLVGIYGLRRGVRRRRLRR